MKLAIRILCLFSFTALQAQEQYIAVFLRKKPDVNDQVMENQHLRVIGQMSEAGILANGGPFENDDELLILQSSVEEARKWLQEPTATLYDLELFSLEIRYGKICPPQVPYEMKTFTLVRYQPTNQIASYKSNSDFQVRTGHEEHLKRLITSGQVIMEGSFGGNDGGMIIYNKDALNNTVSRDPAILKGYLLADRQTIWLNKGSFCTDE